LFFVFFFAKCAPRSSFTIAWGNNYKSLASCSVDK
jgi:hypothetical protein